MNTNVSLSPVSPEGKARAWLAKSLRNFLERESVYLVHSFPQDVLVLFFVNVFALVERLYGQLHFLYCPLLGVQLL